MPKSALANQPLFFGVEFEFWTNISPPPFPPQGENPLLDSFRHALRDHQIYSCAVGLDLPRLIGSDRLDEEQGKMKWNPSLDDVNFGEEGLRVETVVRGFMLPVLQDVLEDEEGEGGEVFFSEAEMEEGAEEEVNDDYAIWAWTRETSFKLYEEDVARIANDMEMSRVLAVKDSNWNGKKGLVNCVEKGSTHLPWVQSEFITPVCRWDVAAGAKLSFDRVVKPFLDFFSSKEANTLYLPLANPSCGLHAHVSLLPEKPDDKVNGLTPAQREYAQTLILRKLAFIVTYFEPIFDLCHSPERCSSRTVFSDAPPTPHELHLTSNIKSMLENVIGLHQIPLSQLLHRLYDADILTIQKLLNPNQKYFKTRVEELGEAGVRERFWAETRGRFVTQKYYRVNLFKKETGTVEFRQGGMEFDTEKVRNWVGLCCRVVEIARTVTWGELEGLGALSLERAERFFGYPPLRRMCEEGLEMRARYHPRRNW